MIVSWNSAAELARSLPAIVGELREGDQLIVVDNDSADSTRDRVGELAPTATLIASGGNLGFGAACNLGAARATRPLLLFLNPDAVVGPGFREAIARPLAPEHPGANWAAWQGLVTAEEGETVNTWGGVINYTGIAWAGGAGRPIGDAPAEPRELAFPSGACLAIKRAVWAELGGFSPEYFLYHEDTDLGLRLWLAGHRCGIEPRARADHAYEFGKGAHKWFYLERNRLATIVRVYPGRLPLLLLPILLAIEPALLIVAALGGWLPEKLRADWAFVRELPRLRRERAAIQARAAISPGNFADLLVADLDSAFLGAAARSRLLALLLRGYWRLARRLLGP